MSKRISTGEPGRAPRRSTPDQEGSCGLSRRHFLQSAGTVAAGMSVMPLAEAQTNEVPLPTLPPPPVITGSATLRTVTLAVNGVRHDLHLEPRVTLLDALRERLAFTGTKKGCDRGQCGACTVLVDGRRINSCLTLAVMHEGSEITTIEGIGTPEALHPMQAAFIEHDGFQCGYCTPGQICSAVALVGEMKANTLSAATFEPATDVQGASPATLAQRALPQRTIAISDAEIRERMSGNICRCGAYSNIVSAVRSVAEGRRA
jgi:xanthine dehydrogenase YagT iron-sulfur-binding subunit